jgi:hypothetical protein
MAPYVPQYPTFNKPIKMRNLTLIWNLSSRMRPIITSQTIYPCAPSWCIGSCRAWKSQQLRRSCSTTKLLTYQQPNFISLNSSGSTRVTQSPSPTQLHLALSTCKAAIIFQMMIQNWFCDSLPDNHLLHTWASQLLSRWYSNGWCSAMMMWKFQLLSRTYN